MAPTLADLQQALIEFAPNVLYIWAGSTGQPDAYTCTLQSLLLGGEDELLAEDLPELVAGAGLHALVLNMMSEGIPVNELQTHVPHVVRWKPGALYMPGRCCLNHVGCKTCVACCDFRLQSAERLHNQTTGQD